MDLTQESLGQCCGVLKQTQICLTPQATVGVIGGNISLWMAICQAIYTAILYFYDCVGSKEAPKEIETLAVEDHEEEEDKKGTCLTWSERDFSAINSSPESGSI